MTDNDIIKALEEWIKALKDDYKRLQLLDAPMDCFEESHTDNIRVLSNVLDLINRQKAEIERLEANLKEALAEIEALKQINLHCKAETAKEFAERLCDGRVSNDPVVIAVKVELKEMVGEMDV